MTMVQTPHGTSEIVLDRAAGPVRCLLVLGHGAGGGIDAPDLLAVRDAAVPAGAHVARVVQPYRVAGRRTPPRAPVLDAAWLAAVVAARDLAGAASADGAADPAGLPLVVGGRSSGARVACRTAARLGAAGVVALAFPLHPPGRPERSRVGELDRARPTLVVNGDRDPFGVPEPGGEVRVVVRPGERHDLRRDPGMVAIAVIEWLRGRGWAG